MDKPVLMKLYTVAVYIPEDVHEGGSNNGRKYFKGDNLTVRNISREII